MTTATITRINMLGWRSLWRHKRRTIITILSVAFGLTLAIFFLALGEGGYRQLINDGVRINAGHITIEHRDYLSAPATDLWVSLPEKVAGEIFALPDVAYLKPIVSAQGIARSASGSVGVGIMGVDPKIEAKHSPIADDITLGEYLSPDDTQAVVVGAGLAERLHLDLGKKLAISSADVNGDFVEELLRVKGIFKTGADEMDEFLIQVPIEFARKLFKISADGASQIGVVLQDYRNQEDALQTIDSILNNSESTETTPIAVLPWQKVLPALNAYIKLDRGSNVVFMSILMFLILFTILNTLLMSTLERETEFAMLLAIGESVWRLRLQMFFEAGYIGVFGSVIGATLGSLAALAAQHWGIDITQYFGSGGVSISGFAFSTRIHAFLDARILYLTTTIVFSATLALSLFAMRHVGKKPIVEALR